MAKDNYGAESLTVLEGLDAVRKRPGMYIGTTDSQGLMHCLWEIIDNAVDEALAGACNHIIVTLHDDGSVEVADNGRGIPVDVEPKTKLTGVEVVLTKLHAGAKFGNSSYGASGGLHGVGSSVVNALSSRLDVEVDRDGKTHHMAFHQGHPGVYSDVDPEHPSPDSPFKKTRKNRPTELEIIGKVSPKTTGTRIRYWADPEIFNDTAEFSYDQLIDRVRQTSFLVPGLKITVIDENIPETGDESIDEMLEVDDNVIEQVTEENTSAETDDIGTSADILQEDSAEADESAESQENDAATQSQETVSQPVQPKYPHARVEEFCHTGGVKDFVDFLSKGEAVSDIWRIAGEDTYVEETQAVGDDGELHAQKVTRDCAVDIAMRWTNGYDTTMRSFVNVVETPGGGMHVDGFLQGITKQVRKAIEDNARKLKVNLKDSHMKVERDDILAGLVAVVTVRIAEPQFQGQTKDVLGTAQVKPIVSRMTDKQFGEMITGSKRGYKEQSGRVLEKIVGEMHARVQARKTKEVTRRKNALESASMPPKLSDCQPGNDDVAELFIVEGDSALGSVKMARDAEFQAVIPVRGKILNCLKADYGKIFKNDIITDIIKLLGCGVEVNTKANKELSTFHLDGLRWNKIVICTDADVDGFQIRTLILTMLYRLTPTLIDMGYVYIAESPLFEITTKKRTYFAYTEKEKTDILKQIEGEKYTLQRSKGLGENEADMMALTTMNPETRRLIRVTAADVEQTTAMFDLLLGDNLQGRKDFIAQFGSDYLELADIS